MNFLKTVKHLAVCGGHYFKKHAPTILTAVGVGGAITSVVLAVKGTPKAMRLIEERKKKEEKEKLSALETIETCWKVYIPTAGTLATAVACVIGANCLNVKQQAALLGLYSAQSEMLRDFKKKTAEVIGEDKVNEIGRDAVQKRLDSDPRLDSFTTKQGEYPFYDGATGQIVSSTRERVEKAIAEMKVEIAESNLDGASLNDWIFLLGGQPTQFGYDWGYNDQTGFYASIHPYDTSKVGLCYYIEHETEPVKDFNYTNNRS